MIEPGRYVVNSPVRLRIEYADEAGTLVDPATVTLKTMSPHGLERRYTYGTDANVLTEGVGLYLADITPDLAGRWNIRWESTGDGTTTAQEDTFIVINSAFYNPDQWSDYR